MTKRRSALNEDVMGRIMCAKSWLGFAEVTKKDVCAELDLLTRFQECELDGDYDGEAGERVGEHSQDA